MGNIFDELEKSGKIKKLIQRESSGTQHQEIKNFFEAELKLFDQGIESTLTVVFENLPRIGETIELLVEASDEEKIFKVTSITHQLIGEGDKASVSKLVLRAETLHSGDF